jgi:hypothetical protein
MESTSVYWIPVFQLLDDCGVEVFLVNARDAKHVPGRKTDVSDAQWRGRVPRTSLPGFVWRPATKSQAAGYRGKRHRGVDIWPPPLYFHRFPRRADFQTKTVYAISEYAIVIVRRPTYDC